LEDWVSCQLLQEIHTLKHLPTFFCTFNLYQLCHTTQIGHLHNNLYVLLCEKQQLNSLSLQMQD
jgi:hypothetical protein